MIAEVRVLNRYTVQNIIETKGSNFPYKGQAWDLISINDNPDNLVVTESSAPILADLGCRNTISLNFADITVEQYKKMKGYCEANGQACNAILFNEDHAKEIVQFVKDVHADKESAVLIVHCHAGISRSGAVGTFACDYVRLDYQEFIDLNPYIMSNPHVLSLLRREADMTPSFGTHDGIDWAKEGDLLIPPWFKNANLGVEPSGDAENEQV